MALKLETSLYCVLHRIFCYIEPFRHGSQLSRTDRGMHKQNYDSNSANDAC